jgi:biotin transport system substrate-specific component
MNLRSIIITALFAALLVAGAYIIIPVGPVPITLQTAFVLLAGILGGRKIAGAAVAIYLVLGAVGMPIFSGGIGGFAHFAGPTGGFLISWLIAAPIAGWFTDRIFRNSAKKEQLTKKDLLWIIFGTISGTIAIYLIGIPYMKMILDFSWSQAITVGLLPFIPGDLLKAVAVVLLGNLFAVRVRTFIHDGAQNASDAEH